MTQDTTQEQETQNAQETQEQEMQERETIGGNPVVRNGPLQGMTNDTLINTLADLQLDCLGILAQILGAEDEYKTLGKYSNPEWLIKAKIALRYKKGQVVALQQEMGRRNREWKERQLREKQGTPAGFLSHFLRVVKGSVSPEQFLAWTTEAERVNGLPNAEAQGG